MNCFCVIYSQPDISPDGKLDNSHQRDEDFETLFDAAQRRNASQIEYAESGERSFSDPSVLQENGLDRSRSEEKESEVDSGIAVVEHSVSTQDIHIIMKIANTTLHIKRHIN